jgi:hypothetical protein
VQVDHFHELALSIVSLFFSYAALSRCGVAA